MDDRKLDIDGDNVPVASTLLSLVANLSTAFQTRVALIRSQWCSQTATSPTVAVALPERL